MFELLLDIISCIVFFLPSPKRPAKTALLDHLPECVQRRILSGASRTPIPCWTIATLLTLTVIVVVFMLGFAKTTIALIILLGILAGMAIREAKSIRPRGVHGYLATISTDGRLHHCLACNYNLRGSASPTCPECGEAVLIDDLLRAR